MLSKKFKLEYIVLMFFALAMVFYLNIDKLPLTHPGNLKAADAFYHALMVEGIVDTEHWNYFDSYISMGQEKALNSQPPLYYINSAILTLFSGVPAWATFYFLICISQAFFVILVYLITKEVFENEKIAILAGSLSILPMPVNVWLYTLYIGIWIQVAGYLFLLTFLWLFIKYMKKQESWTLVFMSLCLSSILLLHPQDLGILFIPCVIVGYKIITKNLKDIKKLIKESLMIGLIPLLGIITLLPRFLFLWGAQGGSQYSFGFFGLRNLWFTREYMGGIVFPDLFFIPMILLVIFVIGLVQLIINNKKYRIWIITTIYFFLVTYLLQIIVQEPHYFSRVRALTPFILYPTIAYAVYYFILRKLKNNLVPTLILFLAVILIALPQHISLTKQMQGEHISNQEWIAYNWIHDNADKSEKVLFFGSVFQSEFMYSKRITAIITMQEMQRLYNQYIQTNQTPLEFNGDWAGNTLRATRRYEKSWWNYKEYGEPDNELSILDFDYIMFQNIAQEITQVNYLIANSYITNYNFKLVYDKEGYIIIKNEN